MPSHIQGGNINRDTRMNTKIPTRLPNRFHEYAESVRGARFNSRLTIWPKGTKIKISRKNNTTAKSAADRNWVQFAASRVCQISIPGAAPRMAESFSVTRPDHHGRRTTSTRPRNAFMALSQRGGFRTKAQPSPNPTKHNSSARFLK